MKIRLYRALLPRQRIVGWLAILLLTISSTAFAQKTGAAAAPKVVGFSGEMRIGREITVNVMKLSDWARNNDPQKLVPYLNGRPLKGLHPEQVDLSTNKLRFHLRVPAESKQVWADLLHEPVQYRPVSLSVGLEDQSPFETSYDYDNRLNLTVVPKTPLILSSFIIAFGLILFICLARATDLIRESGPPLGDGKRRRYSLARTQTALWFFLAAITYFCLWLITGDFNTLTPSVLGLIGISSITAVGTRLIHANNLSQAEISRTDLQIGPSAGFFADMLSDATGYSFHRFQMAAWTMLLSLIFIYSAYHNLAMPDFSGGLLALTGISAVTYLGFESLQAKALRSTIAVALIPEISGGQPKEVS